MNLIDLSASKNNKDVEALQIGNHFKLNKKQTNSLEFND